MNAVPRVSIYSRHTAECKFGARLVIRSTPTTVIYLDCLQTTTAEECAEHLWQAIGINVDPKFIGIEQDATGSNYHAIICLDRYCIADFLQRLFVEKGVSVRCKPATIKAERQARNQQDAYKVTKRMQQLNSVAS